MSVSESLWTKMTSTSLLLYNSLNTGTNGAWSRKIVDLIWAYLKFRYFPLHRR